MTVVVVLLVGAALATGPGLAWTSGDASARGMFVGGSGVVVSGKSVSSGSLLAGFIAHTALGLCAVVVLAGRYLVRRRGAATPARGVA